MQLNLVWQKDILSFSLKKSNSFKINFARTQSNAKLFDHHYLDVYKLSKRLNRITGLQVTNPLVDDMEEDLPLPLNQNITFVESEPLQVSSYLKSMPRFKILV